jgi:hypothetical protein
MGVSGGDGTEGGEGGDGKGGGGLGAGGLGGGSGGLGGGSGGGLSSGSGTVSAGSKSNPQPGQLFCCESNQCSEDCSSNPWCDNNDDCAAAGSSNCCNTSTNECTESCPATCEIYVHWNLDNDAEQNKWLVKNSSGSVIGMEQFSSGDSYATGSEAITIFANQDYIFEINDYGSDGFDTSADLLMVSTSSGTSTSFAMGRKTGTDSFTQCTKTFSVNSSCNRNSSNYTMSCVTDPIDPACTDNSDCASGTCCSIYGTCTEDACNYNPYCETNIDCTGSQCCGDFSNECSTCSSPPSCVDSTDCPGGEWCDAGVCVERSGFCCHIVDTYIDSDGDTHYATLRFLEAQAGSYIWAKSVTSSYPCTYSGTYGSEPLPACTSQYPWNVDTSDYTASFSCQSSSAVKATYFKDGTGFSHTSYNESLGVWGGCSACSPESISSGACP